ncbi:hypothetical protein KKF63_09680 [bacterium]|nr:hypothetical protein [bacterium]
MKTVPIYIFKPPLQPLMQPLDFDVARRRQYTDPVVFAEKQRRGQGRVARNIQPALTSEVRDPLGSDFSPEAQQRVAALMRARYAEDHDHLATLIKPEIERNVRTVLGCELADALEGWDVDSEDDIELSLADHDKIKERGDGRYHWHGTPLMPEAVHAFFEEKNPGENSRIRGCALLERGAAVLVSQKDPAHMVTVLGSSSIPDTYETDALGRITDVHCGHPATIDHMEYSALTSRSERLYERMLGYLQSLKKRKGSLNQLGASNEIDGFLKVGMEWEFWVMRSMMRRGLLSIGRVFQKEHVAGLVERNDLDPFMSLMTASTSLARAFLEETKRFAPRLVVSTSTPLCGAPADAEMNIYDNLSPFAHHIALINLFIRKYGPRTEASRTVRGYQAKFSGYDSGRAMVNKLGLRLSTQAAAHESLGMPNVYNEDLGRFEAPFELIKNISNLVNSELFGSLLRIMCFSAPYITEVAPQIQGLFSRDIRELVRDDTGTASDPTDPIRSPEHWQDIVVSSMTADPPVFTLDRASIGKTLGHDNDGRVIMQPQIHSQSRWRIKGTPEPRIRLEVTGPGATSILPKVRMMAVLQMIAVVGLVATVREQDSLEMVAKMLGLSPEDVWGNLYEGVNDYNLHGPSATKIHDMVKRVNKVFLEIYNSYDLEMLTPVIQVALPALQDLLEEGDLLAFAHGKGTLGGALLDFARQGLSGTEVARRVHSFQHHEAKTLARWARKKRTRKNVHLYLQGRMGLPQNMAVFR